jgi:rRNA-processing protein FCF1
LDAPVAVVLEGQARRGVDEATVDGVEIVHASGEGDDTIVAIAEAGSGVVVITADRELRERVRAVDVDTLGPRWLLERLED